MTNTNFLQLIGVLLTFAGMIALTASVYLYGTPLSREETRRAGGKGSMYRLPLNLATIASGIFFLGGYELLRWTKFNLCAFLAYWLPNLPEAIKLLLACQ